MSSKTQTLARYVAGYAIGFSGFFLAIPYGVYLVAKTFREPTIGDSPIRIVLSALLGLVGLGFALWSNAALLFKGKGGPTDMFNVAITPRTKHLVITGPYRFSRNPMVFGAFSWYFALALYWNSMTAVAVVAALLMLVRFYLKATEEKRLLKDFGTEYEQYRRRVAMIIPWPKKGS